MSQSKTSGPGGPVSHNVYFGGAVQSLGLETENGRATLGVMKKGAYAFTPSEPEKIIVISGTASLSVDAQNWRKYAPQEVILLKAGVKFDIECDTDFAYICYYG
ncbi:MAG: pyrimidine/purine nucleoside phosphorylase [Puia sp.]|nr:pyrimidine/purine nucleoside phosphorylase [Puia sp.]